MRRELFVRIVDALTDYSEYCQWRRDAIGRKGLSPLQKCTAAIRQLTYTSPVDSLDEYVRMGDRTALDCLINFYRWSPNDINVLNESPLFNIVLQGNAPDDNFTVNNTSYTKGYYLTDGIYPEWATFMKGFPCPEDSKRNKKIKERQEAARKDVERAFGVLQAHCTIIRGPTQSWYKNDLKNIMYTCIILHNMIIEDEGDASINWSDEDSLSPA
ncbi:uncharacterized protein LOC122039043 [Zingiber officinale]|uniref:uncharacterized protein LOC122039043 n=1 Tax=Zingiber officinale TaxID=94328 RepID=UPI001C4D503B|nr:uncharacterized protein LOC122039043 [Zingiber officinale]